MEARRGLPTDVGAVGRPSQIKYCEGESPMPPRASIHRLRPESLHAQASPHATRCAGCAKPIARGDRFIHLYGEVFHAECAFYMRRGKQ